MRAPVLILEDHPVELAEAAAAVEAEGFDPVTAASPEQALDVLDSVHPVLAIVDWDMSKAPDGVADSSEVLTALAVSHPDTVVIVWAGGLGELSVRRGIRAAHRFALTQDKRLGIDQLRIDLRNVLSRTFGDLRVEHGRVVHIPCGRSHTHAIAVRFVTNEGRPVRVVRGTSAPNAAFRFQRWLEAHHSSARVEACGHDSFRRLVLTSEPPSSLPCPPPSQQGKRRRAPDGS